MPRLKAIPIFVTQPSDSNVVFKRVFVISISLSCIYLWSIYYPLFCNKIIHLSIDALRNKSSWADIVFNFEILQDVIK